MMFDWNEQDQVGHSIWAEFNGNEDHIVPPYPVANNTNNNNNSNNSNNTPNNPNTSNNNNNNNFPNYGNSDKTKQTENQTDQNEAKMDLESWPDLPALNGLNNGDFPDGNGDASLASEYLNDFESDSANLNDKMQVQLEGETEAFGSGNEGGNSGNGFLDCDWGNIGDFDDFDRLFSNGDSIFGSEMGGSGGPFLSQSSEVINSSTVQSLTFPFSGEQAPGQGSSSGQTTEFPSGTTKPHEKSDTTTTTTTAARTRHQKSRKQRLSEKGKLKKSGIPFPTVALAQQQPGIPFPGFGIPGFGIPGNPLPGIPVPKPQDKTESQAGLMTPQEKIEKLRRRQQMQALLAIQQQQQQLGRQVAGNDNLVPQVSSSPRNRDSVASSALLDGSANRGLTPVTVQDGFLKDDVFIEEAIYHQLQETLAKLGTGVRMCIRDSLLRLAQSAMERQQNNNNINFNNNNNTTSDMRSTATNNSHHLSSARGETDISRPPSFPTMRYPAMEEETGTNRIDRTVAHLLFHNLAEKSVSFFNEEAPFSPLSLYSDSEVSGAKVEESRQNGDEMEVDMK